MLQAVTDAFDPQLKTNFSEFPGAQALDAEGITG